MERNKTSVVLKEEREKELDSFYKMTYEIETKFGSNEKQAKELAKRVRIKMEEKLKIYSQPIQAAG